MQDLINNIDGLKIDRSDWKLVKFGDVAIQQKQSVDRENTELTRYVKGQHMYSEDLHLREWGELTDEYLGPAFIRRFEEGDILYGSRRTYLRKVVIAPFEGITSNTTFVMRANENEMDKRLLPFVMMSEGFTQHSIRNSKGSVNPYVNWKDLSGYEFLLPPEIEQKSLVNLLQEMDFIIQADLELSKSLITYMNSLFNDTIYDHSDSQCEFGNKQSKYPVLNLEKLAIAFQYGISESLDDDGEIPVLRMNNLQDGQLDISDLKYIAQGSDIQKNFILNIGDVLFNRTNSYELVGKTCLFTADSKFSFASYLIRIVTNRDLLLPDYLNFYMNSSIGMAKIRKYRTPGVSQSNINAQSLRKLLIPTPDLNVQNNLMREINQVQNNLKRTNDRILKGKKLLSKIINQVF